jgi:hypothetical protein
MRPAQRGAQAKEHVDRRATQHGEHRCSGGCRRRAAEVGYEDAARSRVLVDLHADDPVLLQQPVSRAERAGLGQVRPPERLPLGQQRSAQLGVVERARDGGVRPAGTRGGERSDVSRALVRADEQRAALLQHASGGERRVQLAEVDRVGVPRIEQQMRPQRHVDQEAGVVGQVGAQDLPSLGLAAVAVGDGQALKRGLALARGQ